MFQAKRHVKNSPTDEFLTEMRPLCLPAEAEDARKGSHHRVFYHSISDLQHWDEEVSLEPGGTVPAAAPDLVTSQLWTGMKMDSCQLELKKREN